MTFAGDEVSNALNTWREDPSEANRQVAIDARAPQLLRWAANWLRLEG